MSIKEGEFVLSKTEIEILRFLLPKKETTKLQELYNYMDDKFNKKSNRIKDKLNKLKDLEIIEEDNGKKSGSKVLKIFSKEKLFIEKLIEKFGS
ncbi:MAG: hypothetical protein ABIJ14_01125 [Nanoarchaeota archaeon]